MKCVPVLVSLVTFLEDANDVSYPLVRWELTSAEMHWCVFQIDHERNILEVAPEHRIFPIFQCAARNPRSEAWHDCPNSNTWRFDYSSAWASGLASYTGELIIIQGPSQAPAELKHMRPHLMNLQRNRRFDGSVDSYATAIVLQRFLGEKEKTIALMRLRRKKRQSFELWNHRGKRFFCRVPRFFHVPDPCLQESWGNHHRGLSRRIIERRLKSLSIHSFTMHAHAIFSMYLRSVSGFLPPKSSAYAA